MKTSCKQTLAAALVGAVVFIIAAAAQVADKPNILFILTDNLGYGEIGVYGGGITRGAATPRIDSLG
jgi:arylsulfatase